MQQTKRADAISAENDLSYSVRIEATFGSQFQRTVAIRNRDRMLATWKELVEARHKKERDHSDSEWSLGCSSRKFSGGAWGWTTALLGLLDIQTICA